MDVEEEETSLSTFTSNSLSSSEQSIASQEAPVLLSPPLSANGSGNAAAMQEAEVEDST